MTEPDPLQQHEYLTVRELAELLRIKERKVYDLAASGDVPCSRVTGKLLFPAVEIRAWIAKSKSGGVIEAAPRPAIFLGSHDPLLDWAIRQSRCGLATYFDGSLDGLSRFARGEGVATGLHVLDTKTSVWNVPAATEAARGQNAVLVGFARRSRGLVIRPGASGIDGMADLAGRRVVPRQSASGSAGLFASLAERDGLNLDQVEFIEVARTEDDAVQSVRMGDADATFGLASVAESYGLDFRPLVEERFDILVDRKAWFDPPLQAFLDFCRSAPFQQRAKASAGYDVADLGQVLWNA